MRLLLDTHFVLKVLDDTAPGFSENDPFEEALNNHTLLASTVSLWEAEIKSRIRKLPLKRGVQHWPGMLEANNVELLSIEPLHILADIGSEPSTKDPFDRLLLSTAAGEDVLLLTRDHALQFHPLAWKPLPY
jgi:PIN domain nuclease of toxin-antitoxin system